MQNEQNNQTASLILALAVTIQIIFFAIMIPTIISLLAQQPERIAPNNHPAISIEDFSSDRLGLPDTDINAITQTLTDAIAINTKNLNVSTPKATIRENTLVTRDFDRFNFKTISFIVDIPDIEQSYQVYYNYPINPNFDTFFSEDTDAPYPDVLRSALCISDTSQIIYPNFDCHSIYPPDARHKIAQSYINLFEFSDFTTRIDNHNPTQINLKRLAKSTNPLNEDSISQVKDALSSVGISPDSFTYHILEE